MQVLQITHDFPTLNKYIKAERSNKYIAAKMKKEATEIVSAEALKQKIKPFKSAQFIFIWHRKDKRSDKDNITFMQKYIFDGLVKAGVMENDGWEQIKGSINHYFDMDNENGVTIIILEG